MSRRARVVCAVMVLLFTATLHAQGCGNGVPCRPPVWPLPTFPPLRSPTPWRPPPTNTPAPTLTNTPGPSPTPTLSATVTASPTPLPTIPPTITPFSDFTDLEEAFGTLEGVINATDVPIVVNGTPVGRDSIIPVATEAANLFGYVKGLGEFSLGSLQPLMTFALSAVFIVFFVRISTFFVPVFMALLGLLRKVIELILGFLPG